MNKRFIILVTCIISLSILLCACNTSNENSSSVSIKLDDCKINFKASEDYILDTFTDGHSTGIAIFFNDENQENFAIGSFLPAEAFEHFKKSVDNDTSVIDVYENTDELIYYSVKNAENELYTEYNRIIKLNDNYVLYLGSFDKDAVDTFFGTLNILVK